MFLLKCVWMVSNESSGEKCQDDKTSSQEMFKGNWKENEIEEYIRRSRNWEKKSKTHTEHKEMPPYYQKYVLPISPWTMIHTYTLIRLLANKNEIPNSKSSCGQWSVNHHMHHKITSSESLTDIVCVKLWRICKAGKDNTCKQRYDATTRSSVDKKLYLKKTNITLPEDNAPRKLLIHFKKMYSSDTV